MKQLWRGEKNVGRVGMTAILIMLGAAGCLGDASVEDGDVVSTSSALTFSPAQTGSGVQNGYKWSIGAAPTAMVPVQGNTCFLAAVYGTFKSANDSLWITNQDVGGVRTWVLSGSKGSGSPAGAAFCFMGEPTMTSGSWSQNFSGGSVDLGPTTNRSCYLTGIQGAFNNFFGTPTVRVHMSNGRWLLDGLTGSGGSDLQASAKCIDGQPGDPIALTDSGVKELKVISFADGAYGCALSSIGGYLGSGAVVQAYVTRAIGAWVWDLSNSQGQSSVFPFFKGPLTSTARCTF